MQKIQTKRANAHRFFMFNSPEAPKESQTLSMISTEQKYDEG